MGLVVIFGTYTPFSDWVTGYKVAPGARGVLVRGVFRSTDTLRARENYTERIKEIPGDVVWFTIGSSFSGVGNRTPTHQQLRKHAQRK